MRVSATTLESFRLFMTADWMPEVDLIASIRGEFKPTPQIELGLAYHSVLEHPERYQVKGGYLCNGYQFSDDTMQPMLALIDRRGLFEVKTTRELGDVTVVAVADHILGATISEFKTTCSSFDAEKYLNSYQWRLMLMLFEASAVTYRVACLDDHGNGVVELRSIENMTVYPYVELDADCYAIVNEFADYVTAKGLDGLLRQRQEAAV